jgi:hypothetical protein
MSDEPISDLVSLAFKLASLQLHLSAITVEAFLTVGRVLGEPEKTFEIVVTDAEVDAAARAIEERLLEGYDIGFQSLLRTNFSREAIREMAGKALKAAKEASP